LFSRARANVRRVVRDLLPAPLRNGYHRYALERDFGIERRSGRRALSRLDPALPRGVNFIGWFQSASGTGQSLRSLVAAAEAARLPFARVEVTDLDSGREVPAPFALNVFHVNADGAAAVVELGGPRLHRGRANVGYWYWETEEFPDEWRDRFAYFDEIWVASEFCRGAIARASDIPVAVVPPPVTIGPPAAPPDAAPAGEKSFRFLTMCDAKSFPERKNPLGAVRAFARAFPGDGPVRLVVKVANAGSAPDLVPSLREAAGGTRVEVDPAPVGREEIERLLSGCDAYVSLHRAEGFGLAIAEAMSLGKPVVATGYSGPADFLDEATGYPVRWELVTSGTAVGPYPAGRRWAEPDEEDAARAMRQIVAEPGESARRGENARRRIQARYGLDTAAARLGERVDRLLARLAARP
jgi:glycosyltransferase involved in cell wall biosynthesis